MARLQLNFAVEGTGDWEPKEGEQSPPHSSSVTYSPGTVQTGDASKMLFWSIAALVSGLILLICGVIYQKRSRGGEEYE